MRKIKIASQISELYKSSFYEKKQSVYDYGVGTPKGTSTSVTCIGSTGYEGDTGPTGTTGQSSYQIAVNNGFVGTEKEWVDSLVGPSQNTQIQSSIIAYSNGALESYYDMVDGLSTQSVYFMSSMGASLDDIFDDDEMYVIDNSVHQLFIPAFIVREDSTITGLSFEAVLECVTSPNDVEYQVKVVIYTSPQNSQIYTFQHDTVLITTPTINTVVTQNVYGTLQFSHAVPAGTKIVLAVYVEPIGTPIDSNYSCTVFGNAWAGMNIKKD